MQTHCEAYVLTRPAVQTARLVFSCPHSGRDYPADFLRDSALDALAIRSSEDAFVDLLFGAAPDHGAPLLLARRPRAWLDLNRAADELDPALIDGALRPPHNTRVSSGLGVIPRVVAGGRAIYRGKIPLAEAQARIRDVWVPYHATLRRLLDETRARFGEAILIDCHSMPREALETQPRRAGQPRPEVVLGDRFGTAASAAVMARVEAAFQAVGLRVARNTPFAGAYIAQAYGRPAQGTHVVQVEIDRSLYMHEGRVEPRADFAAIQAQITAVIADLAAPDAALPLAAE